MGLSHKLKYLNRNHKTRINLIGKSTYNQTKRSLILIEKKSWKRVRPLKSGLHKENKISKNFYVSHVVNFFVVAKWILPTHKSPQIQSKMSATYVNFITLCENKNVIASRLYPQATHRNNNIRLMIFFIFQYMYNLQQHSVSYIVLTPH